MRFVTSVQFSSSSIPPFSQMRIDVRLAGVHLSFEYATSIPTLQISRWQSILEVFQRSCCLLLLMTCWNSVRRRYGLSLAILDRAISTATLEKALMSQEWMNSSLDLTPRNLSCLIPNFRFSARSHLVSVYVEWFNRSVGRLC